MHAVTTPTQNIPTFNEEQWLPVLFLLADTQTWLQQLQEGHLRQLPVTQTGEICFLPRIDLTGLFPGAPP